MPHSKQARKLGQAALGDGRRLAFWLPAGALLVISLLSFSIDWLVSVLFFFWLKKFVFKEFFSEGDVARGETLCLMLFILACSSVMLFSWLGKGAAGLRLMSFVCTEASSFSSMVDLCVRGWHWVSWDIFDPGFIYMLFLT